MKDSKLTRIMSFISETMCTSMHKIILKNEKMFMIQLSVLAKFLFETLQSINGNF